MIFSLFWEGTFIRRGAFIRGGAFILKSEILGGRLFEGAFTRGGAFIRGNTVSKCCFWNPYGLPKTEKSAQSFGNLQRFYRLKVVNPSERFI